MKGRPAGQTRLTRDGFPPVREGARWEGEGGYMASKPEQIGKDRRIVRAPWKWIKKMTSRWRRRDEKQHQDPEDAPKKTPFKGWVA